MDDSVYGPPSDYLMDVLAYTAGIRKLVEADRRGQLADPGAIEGELVRIEKAVAHVLGALVGAPQ